MQFACAKLGCHTFQSNYQHCIAQQAKGGPSCCTLCCTKTRATGSQFWHPLLHTPPGRLPLSEMVTGGGEWPTFRTARAQRTVRPLRAIVWNSKCPPWKGGVFLYGGYFDGGNFVGANFRPRLGLQAPNSFTHTLKCKPMCHRHLHCAADTPKFQQRKFSLPEKRNFRAKVSAPEIFSPHVQPSPLEGAARSKRTPAHCARRQWPHQRLVRPLKCVQWWGGRVSPTKFTEHTRATMARGACGTSTFWPLQSGWGGGGAVSVTTEAGRPSHGAVHGWQ